MLNCPYFKTPQEPTANVGVDNGGNLPVIYLFIFLSFAFMQSMAVNVAASSLFHI